MNILNSTAFYEFECAQTNGPLTTKSYITKCALVSHLQNPRLNLVIAKKVDVSATM